MENMLNHNELKKGVKFIYQNNPYEVQDYNLNFQGRGSSVMQVKMKNLITGNVISKNFHPSDTFEEAEIEKQELVFVYTNKEKYIFCDKEDQSKRIELAQDIIGDKGNFLKQNQEIEGLLFKSKIINIVLPIKLNLKVIEAPPSLKTGRAEAGTKQVTLETNSVVNVPVFIKEGDIIEVNTETGEYTRRVE